METRTSVEDEMEGKTCGSGSWGTKVPIAEDWRSRARLDLGVTRLDMQLRPLKMKWKECIES